MKTSKREHQRKSWQRWTEPTNTIPVSTWSWWRRSWQRCRGRQESLHRLRWPSSPCGNLTMHTYRLIFCQPLWIFLFSKDGKERREITSLWDCGLDLGWLSLGAREQILQQGQWGNEKKQVRGIFNRDMKWEETNRFQESFWKRSKIPPGDPAVRKAIQGEKRSVSVPPVSWFQID